MKKIKNNKPGLGKKYKTVLFDFDGTLVDTIPLIVESFQYTFMTLSGIKEDEKKIMSTIGIPLEEVFSDLDENKRTEAVDVYRKFNQEKLNRGTGIFLGIKHMLELLSVNNIRLGVVTSKRYDSANITAKFFEIDHYFDVFVSRDSTKRHKPDPEPLEKAIFLLDKKCQDKTFLDKDNILFVGDSIHDLRCARNSGIDCAIVNWTYMDKEELKNNSPDFWLDKPADILELCEIIR